MRKDQAETGVLFELISARYERRSLLITANQPFGEWGKVLDDDAVSVPPFEAITFSLSDLWPDSPAAAAL